MSLSFNIRVNVSLLFNCNISHIITHIMIEDKSRIRETPTFSTNADSSTGTLKSNPIWSTYPFLRLHSGTIHESNTEAEGQSPPQELEVGPHSSPYLLVFCRKIFHTFHSSPLKVIKPSRYYMTWERISFQLLL